MSDPSKPWPYYEFDEETFKEIDGFVYKLVMHDTHDGPRLGWGLQYDNGIARVWTPRVEKTAQAGYDMAVPLENGEVLIAAVEVCLIINPEGGQSYRVRTDDSGPISTKIGILEMAKLQIFRDANG